MIIKVSCAFVRVRIDQFRVPEKHRSMEMKTVLCKKYFSPSASSHLQKEKTCSKNVFFSV